MGVSLEEVKHIANLAKLNFNENQLTKLQKDLNKVLDYIDKLNELDLSGVEPLENINETENIFKKDKEIKWLSTEEALRNAPQRTSNFFKVPKVIDKE
ncbi:MAG: Asp-tRNA(Asn)/Glu-tRNA(Gln) amidotransferase subunit GatC [Ignavibacteria bacterium]